MFLEKHTSLKKRINSYVNWESCVSKKKLAFAGFSKDPDSTCKDATLCDFCEKSLEGWRKEDSPVSEHKTHSSTCILFSLHLKKYRHVSFEYGNNVLELSRNTISTFAQGGLFMYNLTDKTADLFCFNCGFFCSILPDWRPGAYFRIMKQTHHKFSESCEKERNIMVGKKTKESRIKSMFYHRLLSNEVDVFSLKHYFIDGSEKKIRVIEKPWKEEFLDSLVKPNLSSAIDRRKKALATTKPKQGPSQLPTKSAPASAQSSTAQATSNITTPESAANTEPALSDDTRNSNGPAPPGSNTDVVSSLSNTTSSFLSTSDNNVTVSESGDRSVILHPSPASTQISCISTPPRLPPSPSPPQCNINYSAVPQANLIEETLEEVTILGEIEHKKERGVDSRKITNEKDRQPDGITPMQQTPPNEEVEIRVDPLVEDLMIYVSENDINTLSLREVLHLGMQRMLSVVRDTINTEIETIRADIIKQIQTK